MLESKHSYCTCAFIQEWLRISVMSAICSFIRRTIWQFIFEYIQERNRTSVIFVRKHSLRIISSENINVYIREKNRTIAMSAICDFLRGVVSPLICVHTQGKSFSSVISAIRDSHGITDSQDMHRHTKLYPTPDSNTQIIREKWESGRGKLRREFMPSYVFSDKVCWRIQRYPNIIATLTYGSKPWASARTMWDWYINNTVGLKWTQMSLGSHVKILIKMYINGIFK